MGLPFLAGGVYTRVYILSSFVTSYMEQQIPPQNRCSQKGNFWGMWQRPGWLLGTTEGLCAAGNEGRGDHLVLLVGAEVQQDMQVLELAGRALEDEVSKSRHAQVGATLRQEGRATARAVCSEPLGRLPRLARVWPCPSQSPSHKV